MQNLTLYVSTGGMKVVYLPEFSRTIAKHCLDTSRVEISRFSGNQIYGGRFGDSLPKEQSYIREPHELLEFFTVDRAQQLMLKDSHYRLEEEINQASFSRIQEEFKIMVAKKNPDFFIDNLSMEAIDKLSLKYADNFGDSSMYGVEVRLSAYQKFFVVTSPEYFKFYMSQIMDHTSSDVKFRGKLVDHNPEKWVMGRYENLIYLKELSAQRLYAAGSPVLEERHEEAD